MAPPSSALAGDNNLAHILPALHHALSGSAGTVIATCTLYPLSLVIARLQVQRQLRQGQQHPRDRDPDPEQQGNGLQSREDQHSRGRQGPRNHHRDHPRRAESPRSSAASPSPRGVPRSPSGAATSPTRGLPGQEGHPQTRGSSRSRSQHQQPTAVEEAEEEKQQQQERDQDGLPLKHVAPTPLGPATGGPSSPEARGPAAAAAEAPPATTATASERASPQGPPPDPSSHATRQDQPETRRRSSSTSASSAAVDAEYAGILDALSRIYGEEGGLRALYAGLTQDTAKSFLDSFLFFMFYEWFRGAATARRRRIRGAGSGKQGLGVVEDLAVGMAAGAVSRAFTTPIANVVTRKQTASLIQDDTDGAASAADKSVMQILKDIRQERGVQGLWGGYSATLLLTLNPALTFFLQDFLKKALLGPDRWDDPGPQLTFLLAASSKAAASAITYPFQIAKTRLQAGVPVEADAERQGEDAALSFSDTTTSQRNPDGSAPLEKTSSPSAADAEKKKVDDKLRALSAVRRIARRSIFGTIAQIVRAEGVGSLYDGIQGELLKGFFSHGTTMLAKDAVHKLVFKLYLFTARLLAEWRVRRTSAGGVGGGGGGGGGGMVSPAKVLSTVRTRLGNSLGSLRGVVASKMSLSPSPAAQKSGAAPSLPPALQYRLVPQNQAVGRQTAASEPGLINLVEGSHRVLAKD
ncbi:mitochondrial carrier domain-containing protein [Microdochium bolleyi]|uniref:Mitochondrial carrier domain-containing protein n=1 Tax=Microdochium bolleyi TaxID=196109 RepID=A0A136JKN2_9PEZI|nr:mitochondrial carrier domain-containing protein [Microdochium bolleyi]